MSEQITTNSGTFTKFTGEDLTFRQLKINDAIDAIVAADTKLVAAQTKVADAVAKLETLHAEEKDAARYDALAVGDSVHFVFGRGEKKRVEFGKITAVGNDEKLGVIFAIQIGEGLDASIVKVQRIAVVFDYDPSAEVGEGQAA